MKGGDVIPFPPPLNQLAVEYPRGPVLWEHDFLSPEFRALGAGARCVYLALLLLADFKTQRVSAGLTRIGEYAGTARSNVPGYIREIEEAGLLRVERRAYVSARTGNTARRRNQYVLLTAPSALRPEEGEQALLPLAYLRLTMHGAKAVRNRRGR